MFIVKSWIDYHDKIVEDLILSHTVPLDVKGTNTIAEALLEYNRCFVEGVTCEMEVGDYIFTFYNLGENKVRVRSFGKEWIYHRFEGGNRYELGIKNGKLYCKRKVFEIENFVI